MAACHNADKRPIDKWKRSMHHAPTLLVICLAMLQVVPSQEVESALHSIVFVTKRPGGYDVLLQALARQTNKNYELICIDELADSRQHKVKALASQLGVNLAIVTKSKTKTHPHTRFGIANAFNTGFILSKGSIVTILQDNIYVPDNFVADTLAFHRDHPQSLLSYPEIRFAAPDDAVNQTALRDPGSMTVLKNGITEGPLKEHWRHHNEGTMPLKLWENMQRAERLEYDWLECACCSIPWEALTHLNDGVVVMIMRSCVGVDEALDTGDDCHEVNLKQRSQMIGLNVWNEGRCPVQVIDHHRWERSDLWTRFTRNTNIFRWAFMKQQMEYFEYPLRAPNNFDLAVMRSKSRYSSDHFDSSDDLVRSIRILSPAQGLVTSEPFLHVTFEVLPLRTLAEDEVVCASVGLPPAASSCVKSGNQILLGVHQGGVHVLRVLLYRVDGLLLAEAQEAFLHTGPAHVGELGKLAGASEAATGRAKGECSSVPSGLEFDAVQEVFRTEHDHPKEALLFVFNKDPALVDTWRDGLWAALRIVARHYDIQYLNVNDIIVEHKPEVSYHIRNGTYKLILGWGAFGSPTDYFLNYIHTVHFDRHPKALCIGGNAVPPPASAADVYDLLFYETEWYKEQISFHPLIRQAFGINTNIYHELPPRLNADGQRIYEYDVLVVGHFLPWKRHYLLLNKPGRKIAIGEMYQEYEVSGRIVASLQEGGVEVTSMLPPRQLADLYRSSRLVYFPMADVGGGERAVLEARACGCDVEIAEDNSKLASLATLNPIPNHETYATQLLQGIADMLERKGVAGHTTRPPMPLDETVVEQRTKELIRTTCKDGGYCPYTLQKHA